MEPNLIQFAIIENMNNPEIETGKILFLAS